jgi:NAD(P)H-hydrate epimerase
MVSVAQARALDQFCVEHAFVYIEQLMEVAGLRAASFIAKEFAGKSVVALAGSGGNGGDALVAARHLANWGVPTTVMATKKVDELTPLTGHQFRACKAAKIPVASSPAALKVQGDFVVLDGVLGCGANRAPRGVTEELIQWANGTGKPIVSIDVPSGVDADSGAAPGEVVNAAVTLSLAAPKTGLANATTAGEIAVVDIGVPRTAWSRLRMDFGTPFSAGPITRWDR